MGREPNASGQTKDIEFRPFYQLHRRTYATYWDVFTPSDWEAQRVVYADEAERRRRLEAATIAYLEPGETVFEREFNYQAGPDTQTQRMMGRPGRRGRSWFSYDIPVDGSHPMTLLATYYSEDRRGTPAEFAVLVDGQRVAMQSLRLSDPPRFFDVEYAIEPALVARKQKVTVRFEAVEGNQIATVFALRMIRADAPR